MKKIIILLFFAVNGRLTPVLVEAIKELKMMNDELKNKNQKIESRLERIEAALNH